MESKKPLGPSPAVLANRDTVKPSQWCPKPDLEFDRFCDPMNPKTILHSDVIRAAAAIKDVIPKTPLVKSLHNKKLRMDLYYKYEIFHKTGSFSERGALYSLKNLSEEQRQIGVITASSGNWAMALAYHGQNLNVPVTVVLPVHTTISIVDKCKDFGATVILFGANLGEAKRQAFVRIAEKGGLYINGYDYPDVIAGAGTIGIEILNQLPQTEAILIPVGGGGLIAGVATVVKHFKPDIKIYGIEPNKSSCFFDAMQNRQANETSVTRSMAETLEVSIAGFNAFHTARPLIEKMDCKVDKRDAWPLSYYRCGSGGGGGGSHSPNVGGSTVDSILRTLGVNGRTAVPYGSKLKVIAHISTQKGIVTVSPRRQPECKRVNVLVDDDCIAKAMLHLFEEEKYAVEATGAVSLSALLATHDKLPELRGKKVVCLVSGGNIDHMTLPKCLARAKVAEGRLIKVTITLPADGIKEQRKALSMVANVGCNILDCYFNNAWTTDDDFFNIYLTLVIETRDLEQSCSLKRVMERLFPNLCDFMNEPCSPTPICACFPKRF